MDKKFFLYPQLVYHISHVGRAGHIAKGEYGVDILDIKFPNLQVHSKQRNSAFIAVLHLKVTLRPSTRSKNSHLAVSSRPPQEPVRAEFFARTRRHNSVH